MGLGRDVKGWVGKRREGERGDWGGEEEDKEERWGRDVS